MAAEAHRYKVGDIDVTVLSDGFRMVPVNGNYLSNTTNIPNGKGLMVIDGSGITIDGLEFSGAKVVDQNGAGIRYEGGDLTIRRSYFHDNENGILGEGGGSNTLLIENSIFQKNGYCPQQCAHNVYIGYMGRLIFRFNKSIDSHEGHTLKSRASINEIMSNYLSTKMATVVTKPIFHLAGRFTLLVT